METNLELSELRAYTQVFRTGSFTRAAEQLGLKKAHVSRIVSQLERKLGVRLLERTTRALRVTEVGQEIHERGLALLSAAQETLRAAQARRSEPNGTLRLTAGAEFGVLAVHAWIAAYMQRYPAVIVEAEFTSRLVDIVQEQFDVAIRVGRLPDSGLNARKLGVLRYGLYANAAYLKANGVPRHPDDLANHRLLMFSGGTHRDGWRLQARNGRGDARTIRGPVRARFNNALAVRDAAVAGLGIALLPRLLAAQAAAKTKGATLVDVLPNWERAETPVHALYPSSRYLAPKVRAFIDLAVQQFAETQAR